jgi:pimeloyl-ACP methyl ester carboxylesterase
MRDLPVLLLPGTLCTAEVFSHAIEVLEADAPCVDVVPFGPERSIEEMAERVAERIPDGEKAALAGFSMGGMAALAFAHRYPDRIDRLALLNSTARPDPSARREQRERYITEARRSSVRQVLERGFLRNYLYRQQPRHRELIVSMALQLGPDVFEAQTVALAERPDLRPVLAGLDCPVMILGARHDVLCPPEVQLEMRELARDGRLVMLEESGHFALLERPRAVGRALRQWYRGEGQRP